MKAFVAASFTALWATASLAQDLLTCGDAQYYPSQYTCYDGDFLCPILMGEATLPCADACYSPLLYSCEYGQLKQLPIIDGPFTVEAFNPSAPFNGKKLEACDERFLLGPDEPCAVCPRFVPPDTCPPGNETIFLDEDDLYVVTSETQPYYIEENGRLAYTLPNSGRRPDNALSGVSAYENGAFTYQGANWIACPIDGEGPDQRFEVFANLPGLFFIAICFPFQGLVIPSTTGEAGAWVYSF